MTHQSQPMSRRTQYLADDASRAYAWLEHQAYTELNAIDPARRRPTCIAHVNSYAQVEAFVTRYAGRSLVCWGLNERPKVLTNDRGYARSARNSDIEVVSNLALDIDMEPGAEHDRLRAKLVSWVQNEVGTYIQDLGGLAPVYVDTGRGVHVLIALPRTKVADYQDLPLQLAAFRDAAAQDWKQDLSSLEARLDRVQDLRRVLRVPGTAKPDIGYMARFVGYERTEDRGLLEHILSLQTRNGHDVNSHEPAYGARLLTVYDRPPVVFEALLERDAKLRDLWLGRSKPEGSDTSGSGYDISLIRRCLILGVHNVSELATILALRPNGSVQGSGKGEVYIRRTIAAALAGK